MSDDEPGEGSPPSGGTEPGKYVPRHARGAEAEVEGATHRRAWPRRLLVGVNIVVALALLISASAVGYALWRLNQIDRIHIAAEVPLGHDPQSQVKVAPSPPGKPAPPPLPAETFLIVGSDTRVGLNQQGDQAYGPAAAVGGARSDTIMLARVVPATKQIALLSIPRDTYLDIPTLGMQKINAALGVSPNLLVQVIESSYGIDINHFVDVDFDSFKDIADALGGVQIYFPTPVRDVNAGLYIGGPGCVNLTGSLALSFVRSREYTYYLPGRGWVQEDQSDLARIERQQMFVRKLAAKAQAEGLGNPITLDQIIAGLTKNLTVDDSLSNQDLVKLAATFRNINPADIVGWTMPASPEVVQTSSGPNDVLVPDKSADQAMVAQFLAFGAKSATPAPSAASSATGTSVATTTAPSTHSTDGHTAPPQGAPRSPRTTVPTSSTLPASRIAITVINGSGITGQAGRTGTALGDLGFDVVGMETGATFGHTSTVVEYGPDGLAAAHTVAAYLEGPVTLEESAGLGPTSIDVITGSLTSVSPVPVPAGGSRSGRPPSGSTTSTSTSSTSTTSTSTTSTSTTSTTVPAVTSTTYSLPGTPKAGAPSCPS